MLTIENIQAAREALRAIKHAPNWENACIIEAAKQMQYEHEYEAGNDYYTDRNGISYTIDRGSVKDQQNFLELILRKDIREQANNYSLI